MADMRRKIVIAVTLIASMCLYPIGTAMAGETDESSVSENETLSGEDILSSNISEDQISENISEDQVSGNVSEDQVSENVSGDQVSENVSENEEDDTPVSGADAVSDDEQDISSLQIPERLKIIIDPLEVDGRGQIYSDEYKIRNDGRRAGVLTLYDLSCRLEKGSPVIVRKDTKGLHEGEERSVHMEVLFNGTDRLILTQKASEYEVELGPGEELSLRFTGEVNENASEGWTDQGVSVNVSYSWEPEEKKPEKDKAKGEAEAEPEAEVSENGIETEEGVLPTEGAEEDPEEEYERIDVTQIAPEKRLSVNSWKTDEKGDTESAAYILRNNGEKAGILTISGPMYGMLEEEDAESISENDAGSLSDNEGETVRIRLISGNDEESVISQGSAGYEVKLEPGEEVPIRFTREIKEQSPDGWPDEEKVMTVLFSWDADIEETEELIYEEDVEMPGEIGTEEKDEKSHEEPEEVDIEDESEEPEKADIEEGVSENDGTGTDTAGGGEAAE